VLHQVAAERDVEDLQPAADRQQRRPLLEARAGQSQLGLVALGPGRPVAGSATAP
jgi:hypothetical protein